MVPLKMDGLSWFIMDIIKMDDLGYPILGNLPLVIARLDHQISIHWTWASTVKN